MMGKFFFRKPILFDGKSPMVSGFLIFPAIPSWAIGPLGPELGPGGHCGEQGQPGDFI